MNEAKQPATDSGRGGSERLSIGVLSITAVILLVGVVVVSVVNDRAMAIGMSDRGGDYILVTMQFNIGTENVVVTDAAAQRMNVYGLNLSTKRVDIWTWADLRQLQRKAQPPQRRRR